MVDFLGGGGALGGEAVLKQWVGGDVGVANLAPAGVVTAVDLRAALPATVVHGIGVMVFVAEPFGCAPRRCREYP